LAESIKALDYSATENWIMFESKPKHAVDVLYAYPTCDQTSSELISPINDAFKQQALFAYKTSASVFESFANIFAPVYRQFTITGCIQVLKEGKDLLQTMQDNVPTTDMYAALDYYFEHCNNGRPYILASHSQGSSMFEVVLSEYMKQHPDYYEQMIAAYLGGFTVTKDWLADNAHIKYAEGETDTGVVIAWNTEGPGATKPSFVVEDGAMLINPLNWKRDETPATVEENLGSLLSDGLTHEIKGHVKGIADATLDLKRGVVVCTTFEDYMPKEMEALFGDKSLHFYDWGLYYDNLGLNGKKRAEAFLGRKL